MQATNQNGQTRPKAFVCEANPLDSIIEGIARDLGYTPQNIPSTFDTAEAAKALNLKPVTLSSWRSHGTSSLQYLKIGRRVRYPLTSIAEFILSSMQSHTDQKTGGVS